MSRGKNGSPIDFYVLDMAQVWGIHGRGYKGPGKFSVT